jgi:hypothetical protein
MDDLEGGNLSCPEIFPEHLAVTAKMLPQLCLSDCPHFNPSTNGASNLNVCRGSLQRQTWPDAEVVGACIGLQVE